MSSTQSMDSVVTEFVETDDEIMELPTELETLVGDLVRTYDDGFQKLVLAPNMAKVSFDRSHSGHVLVFNKETPFRNAGISADEFATSGVSFVECTAPNDEVELSESYFLDTKDGLSTIYDVVNRDPQHNDTPRLRKSYNSDKNAEPNDTQNWGTTMGDRGYIGVFQSSTSGSTNKSRYFLGVKTNLPQLSKDLVSEFEEAIKDGVDISWEDVASDPVMVHVNSLAERNRMRILYDVAKAFDVKVPVAMDSYAYDNEDRFMVDRDDASVINADIHHLVIDGDSVLYYNDTFCTASVTNGLVMGRTPYKGPVLVYGSKDRNEFGGMWTNSGYNMFPSGTGRVRKMKPTDVQAVIDAKVTPGSTVWGKDEDNEVEKRMRWADDSENEFNYRLIANTYRDMKKDAIFYENMQGLSSRQRLKYDELKPVLQMLAPKAVKTNDTRRNRSLRSKKN